jgi:hypothetical protein
MAAIYSLSFYDDPSIFLQLVPFGSPCHPLSTLHIEDATKGYFLHWKVKDSISLVRPTCVASTLMGPGLCFAECVGGEHGPQVLLPACYTPLHPPTPPPANPLTRWLQVVLYPSTPHLSCQVSPKWAGWLPCLTGLIGLACLKVFTGLTGFISLIGLTSLTGLRSHWSYGSC